MALRVLVVDDYEPIRRYLSSRLEPYVSGGFGGIHMHPRVFTSPASVAARQPSQTGRGSAETPGAV